ncbi:uncharacterized protein LOC131306605 [Rhododendron vialii]|uniref:uncharacterized protein LOC131306605 n=1 Tax=Rhododendron vialii TaxID=182163 RepID=UPI00265F1F28|nr:uncharacterized protein LOC131306605 [Rhododendron vialii]
MNKFLPAWESNNYIDCELDKQNFNLLSFVDDPRVVEVYKKAAEDRKTREKGKGKLVPENELGKEKEDFKFGSFKKILRDFRNFDEHYNKPSEKEGYQVFQPSHVQGFQAPRPQALVLISSSAPTYHTGPSYAAPPYFGSGYPHGFSSESASFGQPGNGPGFYGDQASSSSSPWYFDSGATAHMTTNGSHISQSSPAPSSSTVAVGSGQTISVTNSGKGQTNSPSFTSGALPPGSLSPSSFF